MDIGGRNVPGWIVLYFVVGLVAQVAGVVTDDQSPTGFVISLAFLAASTWLLVLRIKWFWVLSIVAAAFMLLSGTVWLFDDDWERSLTVTFVARGAIDLVILLSPPAQRWMNARSGAQRSAEAEAPAASEK